MELDDVLRLLSAAEDSTFDSVEFSDGSINLKLERKNYRFALEREGNPFVIAAPGALPGLQQGVVAAQDAENTAQIEQVEDEFMDTKEITSPLIGVFHQLPGGNALKAGDKVKKGDVICMVEAMKLMNEIIMPEDGEIVWVAVNDNTMVEYGDLLYRYV